MRGAEVAELGPAAGGGECSGKAGVGREFSWPAGTGAGSDHWPLFHTHQSPGASLSGRGISVPERCLQRSKGSRTEVMLCHQPPV